MSKCRYCDGFGYVLDVKAPCCTSKCKRCKGTGKA